MIEETETPEYQEAVEKVRNLSPNWESWLARKPSMEAVHSLIDELMSDEEASEELRIIGGLTYPRRRR